MSDSPNAFLVAKALRPGDIVLTRGHARPFRDNWPGLLVRLTTLSHFSHVSIVVTRLGLLETNGKDDAAQISFPDLVIDGATGDLLIALNAPQARVLRSSDELAAQAANRTRFEKNISTSAMAYLGRDYPPLSDILQSTRTTRLIGRMLRRTRTDAWMSEWVCSGLVAQAYKDSGVDLFGGMAKEIAPCDFARRRGLEAKNDAVRMRVECQVKQYSSQPPHVEILGELSNANIGPMLTAARRVAANMDVSTAASGLQAQLSKTISAVASEMKASLKYEEKLVSDKIIPPL